MEKADAFKKSRRMKTVGVSSNLTVYSYSRSSKHGLVSFCSFLWTRTAEPATVRVFAASSSVALHDVMSVWAGSQRDLTF